MMSPEYTMDTLWIGVYTLVWTYPEWVAMLPNPLGVKVTLTR